MLHGWGDCGASFQFLVDELKGDWHVIAPDWRGFGRTQYRAPGYWFPDYLADLDELLRIYQPDEPVRLLGHSMGGNVAGLYAGVLPERVAAFVNVEGFGLPDTVPDGAPAHLRRWLEAGRTTPAFSRYRDFAELAVRIARRSPAMPADRAMFVARHWGIESADGLVELRADPAHKLPNAIQYRRAEALACWARITAPVLQVHGEETGADGDVMTWLRANAEPGLFPDAEAVTISNAGHMVHFEQPAALAGAVERFLGHPGRAVV
jgi:pimeloyl-ACP methyl ester carboxylesterase